MEPTVPSEDQNTKPTPADSPVVPTTPNPAPQVVQPMVVSIAEPEPDVPPAANAGQPPATGTSEAASPQAPRRWVLPAAILAVIAVLLGGGYVLGVYLPSRPSAVYDSSLKNSGKAVDKLVDYSKQQADKNYQTLNFDGTIKVKSASASFDASLNGGFDKDANGTLAVQANVLGQKVSANIKSVHAKGNTSPDVYVQVSGVKSYLDSYGLSSLDGLDGQWIAIDHTFIDTYSSGLKSQLGGAAGSSLTNAGVSATPAQYNDALVKVQTVNKKYLFTDDSGTAVLKNEKYMGKETKDGRSTYHYRVGYDKAHLQAYVGALKTALDSSKLNDWSKKQYGGKSLSAVLNLDMLAGEVKKQNGNYAFDLWADTKTKLVHSVQFSDPSDKTSVFTVAQNYNGGDDYPFTLGVAGKDSSGNGEKVTFGLDLNTKTNKYALDVSAVAGKNGSTTVSGKFTLTPSNKSIPVIAPSGSKPLMDLLNQLGLGAAAAAPSTPASATVDDSLFTLTQ